MEFPRQEYWNELPFPSLGDLPNPGIEPGSFTLQAVSLPSEPPGKPWDPMHHLLWQPIGKSCGFCFWLKSARCKCLLLASKNLSHLILIFTKEKTNQKNLTDIYLLKAHFFFFKYVLLQRCLLLPAKLLLGPIFQPVGKSLKAYCSLCALLQWRL